MAPITPDSLDGLVPLVQSIAFKRFGNVATNKPGFDLDDLVQEGILGALEAAHRWNPDAGSSFSSFVYFRAHGAMRDHLRRNMHGTRQDPEAYTVVSSDAFQYEEEIFGTDHDTLSLVLAKDLRESLELAIADLPESMKDAVHLAYLGEEKLTRAQIGALVGKTEGATFQMIRTGLKRLQRHPLLEAYTPEGFEAPRPVANTATPRKAKPGSLMVATCPGCGASGAQGPGRMRCRHCDTPLWKSAHQHKLSS